MSTVDRRPTVARNLLAGDRRSVEWALEAWQSVFPPVQSVALTGTPEHVLGTVLGLWDLGRLRGMAGAPFPVVATTDVDATTAANGWVGLAGAGTLQSAHVARDHAMLVVDPQGLDTAAQRKVAKAAARCRGAVVLVAPGVRVPHTMRGPAFLPCQTALYSPGMDPVCEGMLEDLQPSAVVVAGSGPRLWSTLLASGDFFLERLAGVPDADTARRTVRQCSAALVSGCAPPPGWHNAAAVLKDLCAVAGARLQTAAGANLIHGLVMTPHQGVAAAA